MSNSPTLTQLYACWQIARAVKHLDHPQEAVRADARALLRAAYPACRNRLRRVAFRERTTRAVHAGKLLYDLGDIQGLYALLEHYSSTRLSSPPDPPGQMPFIYHSLEALQEIGPEKILSTLETALNHIHTLRTRPDLWSPWSLALSVYAMRAVTIFHLPLPIHLWQQALTVSVPRSESLRTCRDLHPISPIALDIPPTLFFIEEWHVGSSLAAVRRTAVDVLLQQWPTQAFDLLRPALAHPDIQVQLTAIYGLYCLRDPRALVLLQPLAADRRHPLARDARHAIESFGTRLPESLTLVRASQPTAAAPEELLHPIQGVAEEPETLLRPHLNASGT